MSKAKSSRDKLDGFHKVGRIAMRREGRQWNAYWALPDTMVGAILLGSIPMAAAENSESVKNGFIELMRQVVSTILPEATWPSPPQPAPEHERGGNA